MATSLPGHAAAGTGTPLPPFAAVVLTGGTGSRMGGVDKASVTVRGRTLLDHALAATEEAAHVLVVGPPVAVPTGVRVVREEPPRGGPAAGLLAGHDALTEAGVEWLVVWAVDMPRVTSVTVRRLLAAAGSPSDHHDGAVLVDPHGRRQLCLAVSVARLTDVRPPDGAHGRGLFRLLTDLDLVAVPALDDEAVDVDTWADLEAVATLGPCAPSRSPNQEGPRSSPSSSNPT